MRAQPAPTLGRLNETGRDTHEFIAPEQRRSQPVVRLIGNTAGQASSATRSNACQQLLVLLLISTALLSGCASNDWVTLRESPHNPLSERLMLLSRGGPRPTDRTMQLLRRYDLAEGYSSDSKKMLATLEELVAQEPSADNIYSYAELAYIGGKKAELTNPEAALDLYGASVTHAYMYLFEPRFGPLRNPYDPQFRGACDLYNGSLESALRLVRKNGVLMPGAQYKIKAANQQWDVTVVVRGNVWKPEDFERFEFVSDYEVNGLKNQYKSYGLGVPMIAIRKQQEAQGPGERYYPPGLAFPVTAFLRLVPDSAGEGGTRHRALLELHDPLTSPEIVVGNRRTPLESDISTPLAYFLNDPELNEMKLSTAGLLSPEESKLPTGVYMLEPYQPHKIPVLMVHGLWSTPITWMEMFNDLRASPELRDHYQFWFYMYPSGQPFWHSAAQLRTDLADLRATLDPHGQAPALDQMVLVGHSMGGLVSKLQTLESGNDYWNIVSEQPFQLVKASPELKQGLERTFFFRPNPSVRRVVTIGTPHRGSKAANGAMRWLGQKLIDMPAKLVQGRQQLRADNPGLFREQWNLIDVPTSIDSLAPDSPILPVMLSSPAPPWVKYHNIVGRIPDDGFVRRVAGDGDGVVQFESAHLDNVASEIVVTADHSVVHRHPRSVLEVRRILLEHLDELRWPREEPEGEMTATAPQYPQTATP